VQDTAVTFKLFPRNALDKGMTSELGRPNGRKIVSLAYQLGAMAREIAGSLLGHFHRPISILRSYAANQCRRTLMTYRGFAIYDYMRDKKWWRIFL
jgi:hypothetical protein